MLSKTMFATVFMAAAVLSAESCYSQTELLSCATGVSPTSASCSALDKYVSCLESKLGACDASIKDGTIQSFKSAMPALANCNSSPKPSPSPASKPNSSPSPAEEACASLDLQKKMKECLAPLMQAAAGGNVCGGWNNFQCCLIDSVASCGKSKQDEVKDMVAQTKNMPQFSALEGCGAATCAGAPAPAPEKVTALMAGIALANPRDFNLEAFKDAVKKHTGASDVQVVLKAFEILAKYGVTDTMDLSQLKAAIAKANSVQKSQINVESSGRRLSTQRLLATTATDFDVTITVPDAEKAAAVKTSAKDVTKLGEELGQDVSLKKEPEATAKVQTTLTSDPSLTTDTITSKMKEAGTEVGGTVTVKVMPSPLSTTSSASSSFGALLAPVMIFLTVMLAM